MKIVVAVDSLKGSLTSLEAGNAIKQGISRAIPDAEVFVRPLADGGEGTVEALVLGMNGRNVSVTVSGPLGKPETIRITNMSCGWDPTDDNKNNPYYDKRP